LIAMVIARKPPGIAQMWVLPVRHRWLTSPDSSLAIDAVTGSADDRRGPGRLFTLIGAMSSVPAGDAMGAYRQAERGVRP